MSEVKQKTSKESSAMRKELKANTNLPACKRMFSVYLELFYFNTDPRARHSLSVEFPKM